MKHLIEPNVTLRDLQPDTAYLLRVRSITPLGPGPYSPEQEFRTLPPGKREPLVSTSLGRHSLLRQIVYSHGTRISPGVLLAARHRHHAPEFLVTRAKPVAL